MTSDGVEIGAIVMVADDALVLLAGDFMLGDGGWLLWLLCVSY